MDHPVAAAGSYSFPGNWEPLRVFSSSAAVKLHSLFFRCCCLFIFIHISLGHSLTMLHTDELLRWRKVGWKEDTNCCEERWQTHIPAMPSKYSLFLFLVWYFCNSRTLTCLHGYYFFNYNKISTFLVQITQNKYMQRMAEFSSLTPQSDDHRGLGVKKKSELTWTPLSQNVSVELWNLSNLLLKTKNNNNPELCSNFQSRRSAIVAINVTLQVAL